eukprot:CAMPEP_0182429208 /NCGR_PEP_ID=MMETSP1167-20130531/25594_1 /TAXON_ID=2988 /ORGANISM="Mallomonas Sp, Strain CCMP3275" /LENGTH=197 /DNA_ID=CAMNT_0024612593 /DNA_START=173 /DNA_END=766 /DNA_ORIENTATION=+
MVSRVSRSKPVRECFRLHSTSPEGTPVTAPVTAPVTELSRLEIRVGKIVEIEKHPEADSLYVEKVDVGEEEPRTIVSGLVEYCPLETLQGREVIVLCNLKPRPLKGITSYGMLLCASDKEDKKVEPLSPPSGLSLGELITFEGHAAAPIDAGNRASKAFSKVANDFFVNDDGTATYQGVPFMTSNGPCTSTLKGKIS